ncbi:hypothetical protein P175DRAFT_0243017 [Aspergillus ochraceoroseus IBT 24754]|uniref:Uncharacterized protein n=1 Tax=Aspergillus ochraceoroseus IBT 24754 TaxID=1392256 RepID=A0A2T5LXL2_9EURO|nr:uncharacterized protein P175DRAFT_0243017 [Aspergillus ochraceoroseus IBT 24754]PTU21031.1 hypothetical protein P175DRAFT_0243017 [Aspergillus ochraceoroseus IBT 24754]
MNIWSSSAAPSLAPLPAPWYRGGSLPPFDALSLSVLIQLFPGGYRSSRHIQATTLIHSFGAGQVSLTFLFVSSHESFLLAAIFFLASFLSLTFAFSHSFPLVSLPLVSTRRTLLSHALVTK